jgi:uncharacterized protein (DUF433 family)
MSGTPYFAGTRVPARTLIDYLEGGDSLADFQEDFPTASHAQAIAFLEEASGRFRASGGNNTGWKSRRTSSAQPPNACWRK